MQIHRLQCCGTRELNHLSRYEGRPDAAFKALFSPGGDFCPGNQRFRFVYFTEANGPSYGEEFATFIREKRLGDVVETARKRNPNTGSPIKVFVWEVDWDAVNAYRSKKKINTKRVSHLTHERDTSQRYCYDCNRHY